MYELFLFFICIDAQFTPQTDNHEFGLTRLLSSAFTSSSYVCGVSSATSQTMVSTSIQRAGRGGNSDSTFRTNTIKCFASERINQFLGSDSNVSIRARVATQVY